MWLTPPNCLVTATTQDQADIRRTYSGYYLEEIVKCEQHHVDAACHLEAQLDFNSDILLVRKIRH
jgi:hypothetical protein